LRRGQEAEHVADKAMQAASDASIWDYALRESAAIVTKDEDFAQRKGADGRRAGGGVDQVTEHAAPGSARVV
jgi:predicted nuclease of predicted toxin-antitoxin system